MNRIAKLSTVVVASAFAVAAAAGAAQAAPADGPGTSVGASVNVSSFLTMTLPGSTAIAFGTAAPGSVVGSYTMDSSNPTYIPVNVSTNNGAGFSLSVSAADFSGGLLASDLSMASQNPGGSNYTTSSPLTMKESNATQVWGTDSAAEPVANTWGTSWKLTVPMTAPVGSETTTVTYLVVAN